jgi:hypothetical protein
VTKLIKYDTLLKIILIAVSSVHVTILKMNECQNVSWSLVVLKILPICSTFKLISFVEFGELY